MTALLELKQKIKEIYGQYEMYILPVMKFVLALVYFLWINANMGYMSRLNNVFLVLILAFYSAIFSHDVHWLCDDSHSQLCTWNRSCSIYACSDPSDDDFLPEIQF